MNRAPLHSISQIVAMLTSQAENLARELFPNGKREGREWTCGGLDGRAGRGLSICIAGGKQGVWAEFTAGLAGDLLDLIAHAKCGGDKGEALKWARGFLGLGSAGSAVKEVAPAPPPPQPTRDHEADTARRVESATRIFARALPWPGTPVEAYLAGRALPLAELAHVPRALRYEPELRWSRDVPAQVAMLASIMKGPDMIGLHVTFLERGASRSQGLAAGAAWRRKPGREGKRVLGRQVGGYIPLSRGASNEPLARAPAGDVVALCEGIEDALTVATECPDWRVLATINAGNMACIDLPETVAEVVLCLQRDGENPAVARAVQAAIARYSAEGRTVRATRPPEGIKDFNDWKQSLKGGASRSQSLAAGAGSPQSFFERNTA